MKLRLPGKALVVMALTLLVSALLAVPALGGHWEKSLIKIREIKSYVTHEACQHNYGDSVHHCCFVLGSYNEIYQGSNILSNHTGEINSSGHGYLDVEAEVLIVWTWVRDNPDDLPPQQALVLKEEAYADMMLFRCIADTISGEYVQASSQTLAFDLDSSFIDSYTTEDLIVDNYNAGKTCQGSKIRTRSITATQEYIRSKTTFHAYVDYRASRPYSFWGGSILTYMSFDTSLGIMNNGDFFPFQPGNPRVVIERDHVNVIPPWRQGIPYDPNTPEFSPEDGSINGGGDPVSLVTGEHMDFPGPDIAAYNPYGPVASFRRNNYSRMAGEELHSPGLPIGWAHNYDATITTIGRSDEWSDLMLSYANGAQERLGVNGATGSITAEPHLPYVVTGVQSTTGKWSSINIKWKDGNVVWTFVPRSSGDSTYILKKIANRMGRHIEINRDVNDKVTSVTDDSSPTPNTLLSFTYNTDGYISSVADCYGRKVIYTYGNASDATISSTIKCLLEVSQIAPSTATTAPFRWKYDYVNRSYGMPFLATTSAPSPTGTGMSTITTAYDTDANNARVLSLTDPNGVVREYTYEWGKTKVTVKKNGVTAAEWYQKFDPVKYLSTGIIDAKEHSTTIEYNDPNNPHCPTKVIDKNGKVTTIAYDQVHKYGNIVSITDPRGTTTTYAYDYTNSPFGRLISAQQGTKTLAAIGYNTIGLVTSVTAPKPGSTDGSTVTTSYTYDALGNILTVTAPGNNAATSIVTTLNYTTDGSYSQAAKLGQPLTVTDNLGHVTHFRYDARGNVVSAKDALGRETNRTYNIVGQPVLTLSPKAPTP